MSLAMFEAEKGVHTAKHASHEKFFWRRSDDKFDFLTSLDDLNVYPIRIFTVIKLFQIKEEQGLPTP